MLILKAFQSLRRAWGGRATLLIGAVCLVTPSLAWSQKASIRFTVQNTTKDEIQAVHVCPTGASKWGPNLLPAGTVLAAGKRISLSIAGGCGSYDIRLVAPEGREYMDEEVSFCEDDDVLTVGRVELKKRKRDGGSER
jgi:hypothetical protein